MRCVSPARLRAFARSCALFLSLAAVACSAPGPGSDPSDANASGAAGQAGSAQAGTSSVSSGAGGVAAAAGGSTPLGGGGIANGGSSAGHAGGGGVAVAGVGGAMLAGNHSGGASVGGSAGNGGSGGVDTNAVCQMVKSEYAAELDKQLGCNPNAGSQCTNKVAAAPGCECRVFMQPTDPFAIEHLSNVGNGWFEADCSMPSCPAKCTTAAAGTCQADAKSPLGGRCVTP
jgi:hypothetical protein